MSHLSKMDDFVTAYALFREKLAAKKLVFKDEENECRLFDIWLANFKDEKVLGQQLGKKEPWEPDEDDEPWR